ncbi:MAG TPA: sn-glycerol-3-phosphate ABC transporter ATP-binding protein UgpC [Dongiaceae bacterium]|jgi:ABC-type sugar transport system ATPase subunit|nr:sn-glycerol-3-phosphate ABC transporter ATP-binding protein UgpC [Dongiaceae bacterium]
MTATQPAIELIDVGKHYGSVSVLTGVNLAIADGEFIALLGPSGCGKSTLLKLIAGLEELSGGEIYVGGQLANYLKPSDRDVAMVFQNYALYPHMTVRENIGFPLKMRGLAKEAIGEKVQAAAAFLQLGAQLDRFPDELSGGQRQRVALGRAIVREPLAFLMDEPLSNLDALLRVEMRTELVRLHKRVGRTTIYVTHDQVEAMTMANRIVLMHKGVIQQVGTPSEVYSRPANTFVATFVGSPPMNLFQGRVDSAGGCRKFVGAFELPLDGIAASEGTATLGIRPEQVQIVPTDTPQALGATVELVERVGADSFVVSQIADGVTINARVDGARQVREGDRVAVRLPAAELRLFDAAGRAVD